MPFFRFVATTPYCGEEITEYIEIPEDELASVDEICSELTTQVADMYWDGEMEEQDDGEEVCTDGCYTQEEYYSECTCVETELSKEEFLDEGGILNAD